MYRTVFISFLQQLRLADRRLFISILCFVFLQLFLTFIKLEVTPFFLYGMYSESVRVTDTFTTIKIFIADRPLEAFECPVRERYLLETTAANYLEMAGNRNTDVLKTRIETRYPFIYRSPLYPSVARKIYNQPEDLQRYRVWLKQKCLKISGRAEGTVRIVRITSALDRTAMQLNQVTNETLADL